MPSWGMEIKVSFWSIARKGDFVKLDFGRKSRFTLELQNLAGDQWDRNQASSGMDGIRAADHPIFVDDLFIYENRFVGRFVS